MSDKVTWITTATAKDVHGIPRYMVYRHGQRLERMGLAKKLDGERGQWLLHPTAIPWLRSRKGRVGRPRRRRVRRTRD